MIKGKDLKWHYDACIEMWNEIAESMDSSRSDYGIDIKQETTLYKMYIPYGACFACEAYMSSCNDCPFTVFGGCLSFQSPYKKFDSNQGTQQDAIAIAQLFIDYYPY